MKLLLIVAIAIVSLNRPALSDDVRTLAKKINSANGKVQASGRWIVTKRVDSTAPHIAQLNSVEIVCNKAREVCHESVAALYTKEDVPQISWQFLTALISEFKVTRWDASGITAISATPVADVELRINVKTGTVTRRHQETRARGNTTANPNLVVVWELQ